MILTKNKIITILIFSPILFLSQLNSEHTEFVCSDISINIIPSEPMVLIYKNMTPQIIDTISYLESRHNPRAIGDGGKAFGSLQIHKIAVDDYNRLYNTNYQHADMLNDSIARIVCEGLLNYGIKLYYNKYDTYPSVEELLRMWNGGIYNGYSKNSTITYIDNFRKLKATDTSWI
jgi:hypothetical protein